MAKLLACQRAVASLRYFSLAASIFESAAQAAIRTDWMAPIVATEIGAGRAQLTMEPSGVRTRMVRMMPSFQMTSEQSSGNMGARTAPKHAELVQFTGR